MPMREVAHQLSSTIEDFALNMSSNLVQLVDENYLGLKKILPHICPATLLSLWVKM
jgi:hypothetical protein